MEFAYITDPGKVRDHNEDSVIIVKNANNEYLMAVADGMGGHRGGEIASSIVISHIGKRFTEISSVGNKEDAVNFIANKGYELGDDQISKEITYFRNYYKKLLPKILIIYERTAYKEIDGDIRLTIDENPRYRTYDLNLHTSNDGMLLLPNGSAILEIKVQEQMPLWLTEILSKGQIYKTTFSKVGTAYQRINTPHAIEERIERRLTV